MSQGNTVTLYMKIVYSTGDEKLGIKPADIAFFQTKNMISDLSDILDQQVPSDLHVICMESRKSIAVLAWTIILMKKNWPWIEIENMYDGCYFKIRITPNDQNRFMQIWKSGKMRASLSKAFEEKDFHLRELLGRDFDEINSHDLEKLENVRILSIEVSKDLETPTQQNSSNGKKL